MGVGVRIQLDTDAVQRSIEEDQEKSKKREISFMWSLNSRRGKKRNKNRRLKTQIKQEREAE